jgi:eukaryotic-like serine/threonine-protein kinase
MLWLRPLDSFTSRALVGTDDALMPFWSPDGRSIGFFAGGKLKRIDPANGSTQTIAEVPTPPRGGTWGSRDVIVFSSGTPPRLAGVSARVAGAVTSIPTADGGMFPRFPSFLPDGRHFLYSDRVRSVAGSAGLYVASVEPGFEPKRIVASDSNGVFASPGLLLFMREITLLQQRFDLDRMEVTGEAMPIVQQVSHNPGVGLADFSVSATGVLAYRSASNRSNQFAWFDRAGHMLETVGPPGNYRTHDLSPDGKRLVFTDVNQGDLWIFDLSRQTLSKFTANPGVETAPVWFPDGTKIAYRSEQGGLFEKDASGTGTERLLLDESVNGPCQISPDGKWLLYFAATPGKTQDIFVLPMTGDRKPKLIVQTPFPDVEPQLSPDEHGRWLAYASTETGRNEIYVQPFPSTGQRWPISNSGGRQPLWRADGKELFFVSDDKKFYAVDILDKSGSFDYGVPHFLFDMPANVWNTRNSYVPSRDGKRFLVNMLLETDDAPISVVQNWQAGLKK